MSEKVNGPAAGTRSSKKRDSNSEVDSTDKSNNISIQCSPLRSQEIQKKLARTTKQQSLHSFVLLDVAKNWGALSDSEITLNKVSLKSRSTSGKIYSTAIQIPTGGPKMNLSDNNIMNELSLTSGAEQMLTTGVNTTTTTAAHAGIQTTCVNTCHTTMTANVCGRKSVPTSKTGKLQSSFDETQTKQTNPGQHNNDGNKKNNPKKIPQSTNYGTPRKDNMVPENTTPTQQGTQMDQMMTLLQTMTNKLTAIQDDVKLLKDSKVQFGEQINGMMYDLEDDQEELVAQKKQLNKCNDRVDILANIVERYEDKINVLTNRCNTLELRMMQSEIIIFGLKSESENCIETAKSFFISTMEINNPPNILYAYWKGNPKNEYRPLVVKFVNPSAKATIFANVSKFKGKKNPQDRPYRINNHLPESLAEVQKRHQGIIAANNKLSERNKQSIKRKGGKLFVNNVEFKPKVQEPSAASLLDMDEDMLQNIREFHFTQSKEVSENNSKFIAYATNASCVNDLCHQLQHIRRKYSSATHMCMAYRVAGVDRVHGEGYVDDSEHSMGRRMLGLLTHKEIQNTVIFLIRFYGGTHIGTRRFVIMRELVEEPLMTFKGEL